jgi:DNA-binding MarR family transcriptional regulator
MGDHSVFDFVESVSGENADELRGIAARLAALADRMEGRESSDHPRKYSALDAERNLAKVGQIAARLYASRRKRTNHLPEDLFGEPAWDILLDLVIQQSLSNTVSVSSACMASAVPSSTALRWIQQLQEEGLIERLPSDVDRRVQYLKLTQYGLKAMAECLLDRQDH